MKKFSFICTTGFALFSMFFGAGNLVYPLTLGQMMREHYLIAICGFCITAIVVPLVGFLSMMLSEGDFRLFFSKIGKIPGLIFFTLIMCIFGPFGAVPRCLALTYSSMHELIPTISIEFFSLLACFVIFCMTVIRHNVIGLLGKVFTPFLLLTMTFILCMAFLSSNSVSYSTTELPHYFKVGLMEGYQTLDLFSALLFSLFLYPVLKQEKTQFFKRALQISCVTALLLTFFYVGFCYVAAHIDFLQGKPEELLLTHLASYVLGSYGMLITIIIVVLACITTAIALVTIFAEFLRKELLQECIRYEYCLAITLCITYFVAIRGFTEITALLIPILEVSYPLLIILCLYNIVSKLMFERKTVLQS